MIDLINLRAVAADMRYRMDAQSADAVAYAADEIEKLRAALEGALIALATTGEDGCRQVLRKALANEQKP